jgi:hypothetical protein
VSADGGGNDEVRVNDAAPSRRLSLFSLFTVDRLAVWLSVAVIAGACLVRSGWAMGGSWWADDFGFLYNARIGSLSLNEVFYVYGGNLHPPVWLLFDLIQNLRPGSYASAAAISGFMQFILCIVILFACRDLFGKSPRYLVPALWFALSPLTIDTQLWATVAFYSLPFQITFACVIWTFMRFERHPSRLGLLYCLGSQVLCYLMLQKALILPLLLFLIQSCWCLNRKSESRFPEAVKARRALWIGTSSLWLCYCMIYLALSRTNASTYGIAGFPKEFSAVWSALWMTAENLVTGIFGGPLSWNQLYQGMPHPSTFLVFVSVVAIAVLVYAIRRLGGSLKPLLVVVIVWSVDAGLLVVGRLNSSPSGAEGLGYPRYFTDLYVVFAFSIGVVIYSIVQEKSRRRMDLDDSRNGIVSRLPATFLIAVFVVFAAISTRGMLQNWTGFPMHGYLANLRASLDRATIAAPLNQQTPESLSGLSSSMAPLNSTKALATILGLDVHFPDYTTDLYAFDEFGTLQAARVGGTAFTPTWASPSGPLACGWSTSGRTVVVPISPLPGNVFVPAGLWFAEIQIVSSTAQQIEIKTGATSVSAAVPAGESNLIYSFQGPAASVEVTTEKADYELCVQSVLIGLPVPS